MISFIDVIIVVICCCGVGYSSFKIGAKFGAVKLLELMQNNGIIEIDENENVRPGIRPQESGITILLEEFLFSEVKKGNPGAIAVDGLIRLTEENPDANIEIINKD